MIDETAAKDFKTEEQAQAYFDKLAEDRWKKKKVRRPVKEVDVREKIDPYYAHLKDDEETPSSIFENEFLLEDEDAFKEYERIEKNIGRYPRGFRHFENYYNYRVFKPQSSIEDYTQDSK